jgi:hypothetical protein
MRLFTAARRSAHTAKPPAPTRRYVNGSLGTLRETRAGQARVTAAFRRPDGRTADARKATLAETEQTKSEQTAKGIQV